MRPLPIAACAISGLLFGCSMPQVPERSERERLMMAAIEPCKRQYPSVREVEIDEATGRIWAQARWESPDWDGFKRCAAEVLMRVAEKHPFGAGRLAATAASASIAFQPAGALMLVPVQLNGASATFLLDTGSSVTVVRPSLAQRAGIEVPPRAPRVTVRVAGGESLLMPYVRVRSLNVGAAAVEDIEIGVLDGLVPRVRAGVDGVLGANFLNHFRLTIDRSAGLLTLEPPVAKERTAN